MYVCVCSYRRYASWARVAARGEGGEETHLYHPSRKVGSKRQLFLTEMENSFIRVCLTTRNVHVHRITLDGISAVINAVIGFSLTSGVVIMNGNPHVLYMFDLRDQLGGGFS